MAKYTTNLHLEKPEYNETADIEIINQNMEKIDSEMTYKTATGTGTEITLSLPDTFGNGYNTTFIATANNNGAATTVNGKPLYKPNTTTPPNITSGKAYSIWYNSASDCFFLKASAEGNAVSENVLADKTFSNDNDTGLIGTMPHNGEMNGVLNAGESKKIPKGYTDGGTITANSLASQTQATAGAGDILSGKDAYVNGKKVTGNIPNRGEYQYAGGFGEGGDYYAMNHVPWGFYPNYGDGWAPEIRFPKEMLRNYLGITSEKIVYDQEIAGVFGSGGSRYAQGTINVAYNEDAYINLGWRPDIVLLRFNDRGTGSTSKALYRYVTITPSMSWSVSFYTGGGSVHSGGQSVDTNYYITDTGLRLRGQDARSYSEYTYYAIKL